MSRQSSAENCDDGHRPCPTSSSYRQVSRSSLLSLRLTSLPPTSPPLPIPCKARYGSAPKRSLAPRIVLCERCAEAGLLRWLEDYWIARNKSSFVYQGIGLFDAIGANKIKEIATNLRDLAYTTAVLADSDAPDQFSDADADDLRGGATVIKWDGALSLDECVLA